MNDIERAINDAFIRIEPRLIADRAERQRRLARGRKLLLRPPRAWCIPLRANDTRINPATASIIPEDAPYPRKHVAPQQRQTEARHEVTMTARLLLKLSAPVYLPSPGLRVTEVAALLGVEQTTLHRARCHGVFHTHHINGERGRRIPTLFYDGPLFPGNHLFAPSPLDFGSTSELVCIRVPEDFTQTLVRIPAFWPRARYVDPAETEWDAQPDSKPKRVYHLPPPEPDYVPYKWKDGVYLGYDWKKPWAKARHEQHERSKAQRRKDSKLFRQRHSQPSSRGSLEFRGWRWLCPRCNAPVKVLYLPVPPLQLLPQSTAAWLSTQPKPQLACPRCNRIRKLNNDAQLWNKLVSYLSCGLLYGHEVPPPQGWSVKKKRELRKTGQTPRTKARHAALIQRLMQGWTIAQIAAELNIPHHCAEMRVQYLYTVQGVRGGRKALAKKLGLPVPQRGRNVNAVMRE